MTTTATRINWIPTYTGIAFDLLEPTPDMVCAEDIATAHCT